MYRIMCYQVPGDISPMAHFLSAIGPKLRSKVLCQLLCLSATPPQLWRAPQVKHFSIEKYNRLYELRIKNRVLLRVIFTVSGEEILLLAPFIKHQPRDTSRALELSLRMLSEMETAPGHVAEFTFEEGGGQASNSEWTSPVQ